MLDKKCSCKRNYCLKNRFKYTTYFVKNYTFIKL